MSNQRIRKEVEQESYAGVNIGKPDIIPFANMVIVCGKEIMRPASISPSQWLGFWERVTVL